MKTYKFVLSIGIIATLFSCVDPENYVSPDLNGVCGELIANKSVFEITSKSNASSVKYVNDDIIEAYVTSSDEGGNFYKSISFVSTDGKTGFSLPIDDYNLYSKYEPGRKVYINMKDRYVKKEYGSTIIGSLYNNDTPGSEGDDKVGRISGVEYQSVLTASCSSSIKEEDLIQKMSLKDAQTDVNLNKLIELDNVQFTDESLGKKYYDESLFTIGGSTNHLIIDTNGNTVTLRGSQYATFATQPIPSGNGKIIGVMTKYSSTYQFMIRTLRDVQLTEPRVVPFFEESFTSNFPNWIKFSVSGAQVWGIDTQFGNPGSCAKMTGFASSKSNENEDWLISPVQDLSSVTSATLTFDTATNFSGNVLAAYVSNNYTGSGNPSAATWTLLNAVYSPSNGGYKWTNSGSINISAFTGSGKNAVYVAFKYTSNTSASATWEVDNVKIQAN